ncbi:hypothetical protein pb186bvf_002075 [Paramecium bursaria]
MDYSQFTFIKKRQFKKRRKTELLPRCYEYIDWKAKQLFLNLFIYQSYKIQDAAEQAGIKYSSAKTILYGHRKKFKEELIQQKIFTNQISKKCRFRSISDHDDSQITIISKIGCFKS